MVRGIHKSGAKAAGRVVVKSSGSFGIHHSNGVLGANHKNTKLIQWADGYSYELTA